MPQSWSCVNSVVGQKKEIDLLGRRSRIGLNINTPDGRVEVERLERSLATEDLKFINPLVAAVVSRIGQTLGVLVGQDGTIRLHRCARS
jgi:hypothetical protein